MTKTQAVDAIKGMGLSARLRDGEIRVNFAGGVEDTAYYTTDAEDAVGSAELMAKERQPAAPQAYRATLEQIKRRRDSLRELHPEWTAVIDAVLHDEDFASLEAAR